MKDRETYWREGLPTAERVQRLVEFIRTMDPELRRPLLNLYEEIAKSAEAGLFFERWYAENN